MRRLLALLLLMVSVPVRAGEETEVRVIQLHNRPARDGAVLAETMLSEDGSVFLQPRHNTLTVRDRAQVVRRIAEALAAWDTAAQTYRLRIRMLLASTAAPPPGKPVPRLQGFGSELTGIFSWGGFEEIDSFQVQAREGAIVETQTKQAYHLRFGVRTVAADVQRVQLIPFEITRAVDQPGAPGFLRRVLRPTTVSLQIGQTFILVAARSEEARQALVVILAAEPEPNP